MKRIAALLCALLLLAASCSALAEETPVFTFRNGVQWDMSPEEVAACEGTPADSSREEEIRSTLVYNSVQASKYPAMLGYVFLEHQLKTIMYMIFDVQTEDFIYMKNALAQVYGASQDVDLLQITESIAVICGVDLPDLTQEDFANAECACWQLDDGTRIMLYREKSTGEYMAMFYINPNGKASYDVTGL